MNFPIIIIALALVHALTAILMHYSPLALLSHESQLYIPQCRFNGPLLLESVFLLFIQKHDLQDPGRTFCLQTHDSN